MHTLLLVLRDQLDRDAAVLRRADPSRDAVVMTEADVRRGRYPEHKQRLALGWAAMHHFRDDLRGRGWRVDYQAIDDGPVADDAASFLQDRIEAHDPDRVWMTEPGRAGLLNDLTQACNEADVELRVHADAHFLTTHRDFEQWAEGRKELTLEYFYREQRRAYDVLLTDDTDMQCLQESIGQALEHGYTHHIPRLMVIGLFGLLYGVDPQQMNAWHEAMYVDAWAWVSAPNVIGMALYADGGRVAPSPTLPPGSTSTG